MGAQEEELLFSGAVNTPFSNPVFKNTVLIEIPRYLRVPFIATFFEIYNLHIVLYALKKGVNKLIVKSRH